AGPDPGTHFVVFDQVVLADAGPYPMAWDNPQLGSLEGAVEDAEVGWDRPQVGVARQLKENPEFAPKVEGDIVLVRAAEQAAERMSWSGRQDILVRLDCVQRFAKAVVSELLEVRAG